MNDDPDGLRQFGCNPNHYRFVRSTGLRREDFARYWTPDRAVFWASVVALVAGAIIVGVWG